jgi:hypothetical protein
MKALTLLLAGLLAVSGCLCCGGELPDLTGSGGGEDDVEECPPPYMEHGTGCCLDGNYNGVCDDDESTIETTIPTPPPLPAQATTTTLKATTTTQPRTPTTTVTTTTAPPTTLKSTYQCVKNAGYNPDHFFYLYSQGCGSKYTDEARTASSRKGVDITVVNIGSLEDKEIKMMECFYGTYADSTKYTFGLCPRLLCPKTGEVEDVDGRRPVMSQMNGFAVDCK